VAAPGCQHRSTLRPWQYTRYPLTHTHSTSWVDSLTHTAPAGWELRLVILVELGSILKVVPLICLCKLPISLLTSLLLVFQSPRGKLHCVVQSCKILISLLQYAKCGDPPGADDLFPVLVYTLINANPPSLLSTIQYVRNFAEARLVGEDAYWWAQFSTAVEFTKTLE